MKKVSISQSQRLCLQMSCFVHNLKILSLASQRSKKRKKRKKKKNSYIQETGIKEFCLFFNLYNFSNRLID